MAGDDCRNSRRYAKPSFVPLCGTASIFVIAGRWLPQKSAVRPQNIAADKAYGKRPIVTVCTECE